MQTGNYSKLQATVAPSERAEVAHTELHYATPHNGVPIPLSVLFMLVLKSNSRASAEHQQSKAEQQLSNSRMHDCAEKRVEGTRCVL